MQETSPSIEEYGAYYESGSLDGCQPFEERRWLPHNLLPRVVGLCPVLGMDERPTAHLLRSLTLSLRISTKYGQKTLRP